MRPQDIKQIFISDRVIEKIVSKRKKKPPQKMLQQWVSQRLRDELAAM